MQAYIVLKGIGGRSGMEFSSYKQVHADSSFAESVMGLGRGVVRTDAKDIFGNGKYGVELRAGTKNDETRRFLQQALTARAVTGDFSGMASVRSWSLQPSSIGSADYYMQKFGASREEAKSFLAALRDISRKRGDRTKSLSGDYLVPLWNWEEAPFLSASKKKQLRELSRSFMDSVIKSAPLTPDALQNLQQDWVKVSNLEEDFANYLRPRPPVASTEALMRFPVAATPNAVDVNGIDLGLEYTGRFPTKPRSLMSDRPIANGRAGWIGSLYDMTPSERLSIMSETAIGLAESFGAAPSSVTSEVGGHGHGLGAAYFARDPATNGKWRVEWDGVTREYDLEGKVVPESIRGGHVEVVTPKTELTGRDVDNVFGVFEKQGLVPDPASGGGHINFDLAPFDKKPKQFARFLSRFLENRGTMALMFQHIDRLKSAEPLEASPKLIAALKNFEGSESDLKKLLYDERWFNQRVGRKSRYTQIDIASYFQDVIPAEFISKDFDLFNDVWRQEFRVEPHIRKAEFRLFNAPATKREAALQTKFVRALLNDALNETSALSGQAQKVDFAAALKDPKRAEAEFERTMARLKLDPAEYREFFLNGLETARARMNSLTFTPLEQRLANNPKAGDWKLAVEPRAKAAELSSEARAWDGKNVLPEAKKFYNDRMAARALREELEKAAAAKDVKRLRRALSQKGKMDIWRRPPEDEILPFLYAAKTSPDAAVQKGGEVALRELKARVSFPAILETGVKEAASPGYAKFLAEAALENQGKPSADLLRSLMSSNDAELAKVAPQLLKRIPLSDAQERMIQMMSGILGKNGSFDSNFAERWASVYGAMKFPSLEGGLDPRVEKFEQIFKESNDYGQYYLASWLGNLEKNLDPEGKAQLYEVATRLLSDPATDRNYVAYLAEAIMNMDAVKNDPVKLNALMSHPDDVVTTALKSLRLQNFTRAFEEGNLEKRLDLLERSRSFARRDRLDFLRNVINNQSYDEKAMMPVLREIRSLDIRQIYAEDPTGAAQFFKGTVRDLMFNNYRNLKNAGIDKFLSTLYQYAPTSYLMDDLIAKNIGWGVLSRHEEELITWMRQSIKKPSELVLQTLERSLDYPHLRKAATAALMQWPEGTRILAGRGWSDPKVAAMLGTASCQRHFANFGTATSH